MTHNRAEQALQIRCAKWCKNHLHPDVLWTSVPANEVSPWRGAKNKALGYCAGWPDFTFIWWCKRRKEKKILFIELKTEKGKQSEVQVDFHIRANTAACDYLLVRSYEEFLKQIEDWKVPLAQHEPMTDDEWKEMGL